MRPVAMTIVIAERRVLLIQRLENAHHFRWCPPGGKIEQGESVLEAAIRELREETSLVAADAVILGHRPSKEFDAMLHPVIFRVKRAMQIELEDEFIGYGWFKPIQFSRMDIMSGHIFDDADIMQEILT